jgi:UDPglucose 6-dehydrogenase
MKKARTMIFSSSATVYGGSCFKKGVTFEPDSYKAARKAHAVALLTEWNHYRNPDYKRIFKSVVQPTIIFDGRSILDHRSLYEMGFNVFAIGKLPP